MGARHRWWLLIALSACSGQPSTSEPAPPAPEPAEPRATDPASLVGRFESEPLCLVLLANGDVELILNRRPKLLVLGRAAREGETLRLEVERIWSARFLSRCREHHEAGHWEESTRALGVELRPGSTVALRMEVDSNDHLRLCAETCETLTRAAQRLPRAWASEDRLPAERAALDPGSLLQLEIGERAELRYVKPGGSVGLAWGASTVTDTAEGFLVTFRPERVEEPTPDVLGAPLVTGTERRFAIERHAGQRIEVRGEGCRSPGCSTTLERYFDAHAYAIE